MADMEREIERDDDAIEMIRLTVRVTKELREDLYSFAREVQMKPTYYSSLCLTMGHQMMRRVLQPETMMGRPEMQTAIDQVTDPTEEEIRQVERQIAPRKTA